MKAKKIVDMKRPQTTTSFQQQSRDNNVFEIVLLCTFYSCNNKTR